MGQGRSRGRAFDQRRVYALIENLDGGLFRSDDGGEKWTHVSDDHRLRQRHWYYTTDGESHESDEVWFPQVALLKTIDGGKNFTFPRATSTATCTTPGSIRRIRSG